MAEAASRYHIQGPTPWPLLVSFVDFVSKLQPATLSLTSSIILISSTPIFFRAYRKAPEVAAAGYLYSYKFLVCALLVVLDIETLVKWIEISTHFWDLTVIAAIFSCLASLCLTVVVLFEHGSTIKSSATLTAWLTLSTIVDGIRACSYFGLGQLGHLAMIAVFTTLLKLTLAIFEELPKAKYIKVGIPREPAKYTDTCGFWSRTFVHWYEDVMFGFRPKTAEDVLDALDVQFSSQHLSESFNHYWESMDKTSPYCLVKALFLTTRMSILEIFCPRICLSIFIAMQVPLIWYLLGYKEQSSLSRYHGCCFLTFAVSICFGISISRATLLRLCADLQIKWRGIILAQVQQNILSSPFSRVSEDAAKAMINDTLDELLSSILTFYSTCISGFEIAGCLYFLNAFVGHGALVVLMPAIASNITGWFSGKYYPAARQAWQSSMDKRVTHTSTILSQIKAIKMVNLQGIVCETLCSLQDDCISAFVRYRQWGIVSVIIDTLSAMLPGPIAIAGSLLWTSTMSELTSRDAFTILTITSLLYTPLLNALSALKYFNIAMSHLQQMQNILTQVDTFQLTSLNEISAMHPPTSKNYTSLRDEQSDESSKDAPIIQHGILQDTPSNDAEASVPQLQLPSSPAFAIEFRKASIAARGTRSVVLSNVNLSIGRGELVMVVGPTGCGKSTLLGGIVGDATVTHGDFYKEPGRVAYCDQESWLYHASISENVIGTAPFDLFWYRAVLKACLLIDDLKDLIRSDQSLTGPNGSNLSSGQSQRVALARALYLRAPVIVLDDIFAVLDRRTANQIFTSLFGEDGLLRRFPTTVVMATQPSPLLQTADRVILIDSHGKITSRTDHKSLEFRHQLQLLGVDPDDTIPVAKVINDSNAKAAKQSSVLSKERTKKVQHTVRQSMKVYLQSFSTLSILPLAIYILLSILAEGFHTAFVRFWIDRSPTEHRFLYGYAFFTVMNIVSSILGIRHWYLNIDAVAGTNLHREFLNCILRAKIHFLTKTDHQLIMEHFNDGMRTALEKLSFFMVMVVHYSALYFTFICVVASATSFTVPLAAFLPIGAYTGWCCFNQILSQSERSKIKAEERLTHYFIQTATGQRHIENLGWKRRALKEGESLLDASQQHFRQVVAIGFWASLYMEILGHMAVVFLVLVAVCTSPASNSGIGTGLAIAMGWGFVLARPLKYAYSWKKAIGQFARFTKFVESIPTENAWLPGKGSKKISDIWPQNGRILMQNVTARYSSRGPAVLKGVCFAIIPGQKIGIAGRTGSGKSSVLMALLGFLDYTGTIKIDGIDIRTVPLETLRTKITTISHDIVTLDGSVRYNLYPWHTTKPINDKQFSRVLRHLGLWDIIRSRGGLDAPVSKLGLSFGQRQLLSIARGMLHKLENGTKIVVMDETTSSLDLGTEKTVQKAMSRIFGNCTVLVIAHRKAVLEDTDTVLHLSEGGLAGQTYPKQERAAAAAAQAKSEREARRRREIEDVETNAEVEGDHDFDGDDEADDNGGTDVDSLEGTEDPWIGIQPGNVPSISPDIEQMLTYMETPRHQIGNDEKDLGDVVEYFDERRDEQQMDGKEETNEEGNMDESREN